MTDTPPASDPWQRDIEVFPALLRTQTPHLLVITGFVLAGLTFAVAVNRPLLALLTLPPAAVMAAFVALPFLRDTLFVSDGGLVRTNGTWMVQVPWEALCCVRRLDDLWERRSLVHFQPQPVQAMPPRGPLKEPYVQGIMLSRAHFILQATVYGAEPESGRFAALLAQHRPDLVPTEPPPVSKRWRRCPHQLTDGAQEWRRTWHATARAVAPITILAVLLLVLGLAVRNPIAVVVGLLMLVTTLLLAGMQPARWTLTLSPRGLTEEFGSSAALTVPWSDVDTIRRARRGLWPVAGWVVEFAPRAPTPFAPNLPMPKQAVTQLMKRTGGRRLALSDYGLRPDAEPLRSLLAAARPDLLPPTG